MSIYGNQDAEYLKSLERERIALSAPITKYFSIELSESVDPLYNEPANESTTWSFRKGFDLICSMLFEEKDNKEVSVREEGIEREWDAEGYIAVTEWEDRAYTGIYPKEGDVIYAQERYFDVVKATKGGYIVDTSTHVGYKLTLMNREVFDAERKFFE